MDQQHALLLRIAGVQYSVVAQPLLEASQLQGVFKMKYISIQRYLPLAASVFALLFWGCDSVDMDENQLVARSSINLKLDGLTNRMVNGVPENCMTSAEEVSLTFKNKSGIDTTLSLLITQGSNEVRFDDITVKKGEVQFFVEVMSNNGEQLFTGLTNEMIEEDHFDISIEVDPVGPVLQICASSVTLEDLVNPADPYRSGSFYIANIGTGILDSLDISLPPDTSCMSSACFNRQCIEEYENIHTGRTLNELSLNAGDTTHFNLRSIATSNLNATASISSKVGTIELMVEALPLPNRKPWLKSIIPAIPEDTLSSNEDEPFIINLGQYFCDADQDLLIYHAEPSISLIRTEIVEETLKVLRVCSVEFSSQSIEVSAIDPSDTVENVIISVDKQSDCFIVNRMLN